MLKIVDETEKENLKPGEAFIIDIGEGRLSLALVCPQCGEVFVPAGPRHRYNPETMSLSPSVVHTVCGFHKTLTNGEWV